MDNYLVRSFKEKKEVELTFNNLTFKGEMVCYVTNFIMEKNVFKYTYEINLNEKLNDGFEKFSKILNIKEYNSLDDILLNCFFYNKSTKLFYDMEKNEYELENLFWDKDQHKWVLQIFQDTKTMRKIK